MTALRDLDERFCDVGPIRICYEEFGGSGDPGLLLIMGLGMQMIAWPDEFCQQLAARGFYVIRFDNRDAGRSSHIDAGPTPTRGQLATRRIRHPAYLLADMGRDAVGLLDHLGIERAHIVGASMGAMIAQTVAAQASERVSSLVSIMGNTGSRRSGQASPRLWPMLLRPQPRERAAYIDNAMYVFGRIASPGFDTDLGWLREMLGTSFDRGISSAQFARQLGAIIASGNRTRELARITAPTLVVHGTADRLVAPSGGRATARAIRGARLMMVPGMGHDLPRGVWQQLEEAICENAGRRSG
jgi:pimeloyl-ACP methyl ester carboxylesterase